MCFVKTTLKIYARVWLPCEKRLQYWRYLVSEDGSFLLMKYLQKIQIILHGSHLFFSFRQTIVLTVSVIVDFADSLLIIINSRCLRNFYLILNGLLDNSEINRTRSLELLSLRSCNLAKIVRFISELPKRPFNM